LTFLAANVYQIPFKNDSFDIIWCYGVLQHLLSKEKKMPVNDSEDSEERWAMFIEFCREMIMRYRARNGGREQYIFQGRMA